MNHPGFSSLCASAASRSAMMALREDGMIGEMGQHVAQIVLRVDAVQLGTADERVHGGSSLARFRVVQQQALLRQRDGELQQLRDAVGVGFECWVRLSLFANALATSLISIVYFYPTPVDLWHLRPNPDV
jgi:hypothetical protein